MLDDLLLLVAFVRAAVSRRAERAVEHLVLRQRLAVLTRPTRQRPWRSRGDTVCGVLARRLWRRWSHRLAVVRPETVIRWHRQGWRFFWRWRSRSIRSRARVVRPQGGSKRRLAGCGKRVGTGTVRGRSAAIRRSDR